MSCNNPRVANELEDGGITFYDKAGDRLKAGSIKVRCGRCAGCLMDRADNWKVRCIHEASLYEDKSFITLTYDDDHVPGNGSLDYGHIQLFLKRLRRRRPPFRFMCAGEYGELFNRPHYHLLLFGVGFPDRKPIGSLRYVSEELSKVWRKGLSECSDVTEASIAYVSQYCMKKVFGRLNAREHYGDREPEFVRMSLKPGIGARWFDMYGTDVLPRDFVALKGGRKTRVPRYYMDRFREYYPEEAAAVDEKRQAADLERPREEKTYERMAVRERVIQARREFFNRRSL